MCLLNTAVTTMSLAFMHNSLQVKKTFSFKVRIPDLVHYKRPSIYWWRPLCHKGVSPLWRRHWSNNWHFLCRLVRHLRKMSDYQEPINFKWMWNSGVTSWAPPLVAAFAHVVSNAAKISKLSQRRNLFFCANYMEYYSKREKQPWN